MRRVLHHNGQIGPPEQPDQSVRIVPIWRNLYALRARAHELDDVGVPEAGEDLGLAIKVRDDVAGRVLVRDVEALHRHRHAVQRVLGDLSAAPVSAHMT